jgi:NAD(P)-dependent dehydrogenase (short-subunit alcohol dehydrogenase family)
MTSMEGKVCVVTGASSGIGEAIARALHAQGAQICVGARREDKLAALCAALPGAVYLPTDVAKRGDMHALVSKAEEAFGKGVHLLVNVAGVMYFTCALSFFLLLTGGVEDVCCATLLWPRLTSTPLALCGHKMLASPLISILSSHIALISPGSG